MGADLLLTFVMLPEYDDGELAYIEDPNVRSTLLQRIEELDDDTLDDIADQCGLFDDPDVASAAMDLLVGAIDQILRKSFRRDIVDLIFPGRDGNDRVYLFTGGLSYGDSPTDAWDSVVALQLSGITEEPIPKLIQVT